MSEGWKAAHMPPDTTRCSSDHPPLAPDCTNLQGHAIRQSQHGCPRRLLSGPTRTLKTPCKHAKQTCTHSAMCKAQHSDCRLAEPAKTLDNMLQAWANTDRRIVHGNMRNSAWYMGSPTCDIHCCSCLRSATRSRYHVRSHSTSGSVWHCQLREQRCDSGAHTYSHRHPALTACMYMATGNETCHTQQPMHGNMLWGS
jgi:hypothetical protein